MNYIEKFISNTLNKDFEVGIKENQSLTNVELLRRFIEIKDRT